MVRGVSDASSNGSRLVGLKVASCADHEAATLNAPPPYDSPTATRAIHQPDDGREVERVKLRVRV
jgi:hypothetical protein